MNIYDRIRELLLERGIDHIVDREGPEFSIRLWVGNENSPCDEMLITPSTRICELTWLDDE